MSATAILAWVLAAGPSADASPSRPATAATQSGTAASPAPTPPADPELHVARPLVVAVTGLSTAELRNALVLRLPERELLTPEAPRPTAVDFVEVSVLADGTVVFTLITADGHAYDRSMPAGSDPVREVAATITNLTFAIEAGMVEPDRVDVPQPEPEPEPEPLPQSEPEPAPEPAPEPVLAPGQPEPHARPKPPPWELAPTVDLGVIVGLAPNTGANPLEAIHGRIGVDARRRSGALLWAGARLGGWATHSLSLLRVRVDLGGGWAWRWKRAELLVGGAATIEPWALREGGERAALLLDGGTAPRRPLLGALVRVAPAIRLPLGERVALRVGPSLELAGSFVPQDGMRTVDIARANDEDDVLPVMRMGGLELVVGVQLAVWMPVGPTAPRRSRASTAAAARHDAG